MRQSERAVFFVWGETMKLNKKEQRLFDYLQKCFANDTNPKIGDTCKECKTTVFTLLSKTYPSLMKKIC